MQGPFAIVFYHSPSKTLLFGRDILGRRSLLWNDISTSDNLYISSIASKDIDCFSEIPAKGIYALDLSENHSSISDRLTLHLWTSLVSRDITKLNSDTTLVPTLPSKLHPEATLPLYALLSASCCSRIESIPPPSSTARSRLAILFSGGLDCMCLCAISDTHVPHAEPIHLINVAFENPRTGGGTFDTPDRATARTGVEELRKVYPSRIWILEEINVTWDETRTAREKICELLGPSGSVMDFSIALAFWFAARADAGGARVLFSGLGADEMMGGYSRHRGFFERNGWDGLVKELQLDVGRISTRNLGRDDRIIGDAGKEVRFPFLCEKVVSHLSSLPVWIKCDMRLEKGHGDKRLLRLLAKEVLGLSEASGQVKRAIQFGARTAKMTVESGKEKGHDRFEI